MGILKKLVDQLGYEQILLLQYAKDHPDCEMTGACKAADCSWDEAYRLNDYGLASIRSDDVAKRVFITTTALGLMVLATDAVKQILTPENPAGSPAAASESSAKELAEKG